VRVAIGRTRREDHKVWAQLVKVLGGELRAGADVDAGPLRLCREVRGGTAEFGSVGELLGQENLPAEGLFALYQCDICASLRRHRRGLQACRTTADDEQARSFSNGRAGEEGQFPARFWVLDAADAHSLLEMADARLVAPDAGADLIDGVPLRLASDLRIADHRTGHDAQVCLALGDRLLRLMR